MKDVPFIIGDKIYLRELRTSDLTGPWYTWLNDSDVTTFQNKGIIPNSIEKQTKYYESLINNSNEVVLAIVEEETQKHIGCVGLHRIDWVHRCAELGIVIGDRDVWGKKFGKQAWQLISNYGFTVLNLHRIFAVIVEGNIASQKSAEAAGFELDGKMRDYLFKNGKYLNAFYYSKINPNS
jgi:RimJ/RimL family protein N-acetyltransferase